ncbi:uncharacterized protein LOC143909443 [Arctopsyche grandis]|uniref:uncharacterized protein LOC143909443 n=1 Tax=Arctopsyche grandis TaxID=121162 RepID=UPI00406D758D
MSTCASVNQYWLDCLQETIPFKIASYASKFEMKSIAYFYTVLLITLLCCFMVTSLPMPEDDDDSAKAQEIFERVVDTLANTIYENKEAVSVLRDIKDLFGTSR